MGTEVSGNNNNVTLMRAQSESDRQSSESTQARNAMEGFNPQQILGGLMEIFKMLSMISG
jgi:hypothetical protein